MAEPRRERAALTARAEKRLLTAMAARVPGRINSDHLTLLGVLGAVGVGAGYALSGLSHHWLWLASAALAVNWFGDSLDGSLARVRGTERPRYGYYLDHGVDAFTTVLIGVGLGLSPYLSLEAGLLVAVLYLAMSINVYLESTVFGVFRMDYGPVGPTEVRGLLIIANTALIIAGGAGVSAARIAPGATLAVGLGLAGMTLVLAVRFFGNLRRLAAAEPLDRGEPAGAGMEAGAGAGAEATEP